MPSSGPSHLRLLQSIFSCPYIPSERGQTHIKILIIIIIITVLMTPDKPSRPLAMEGAPRVGYAIIRRRGTGFRTRAVNAFEYY